MDKRTSRSPKPGSPFPECPTPTSPMLYERCKSRCAYGLMDFFHFRRRRAKKRITTGSGSKRNERSIDMGNMVHLLENTDEKCNFTYKGVDHNVVKISIEQQTKKTSTANVKAASSGPVIGVDMSRDHGKALQASRRPHRLSHYGCYDMATVGHREFGHQDSEHRSSKKLSSAVASQATSYQMHPEDKEHSRSGCLGHSRQVSADQMNIQLDVNEATEVFINQNLIGGNLSSANKPAHQCKHFFDAIEILSSNKDLFIKLLRDPDSMLVKHVEDLHKSDRKKQPPGSSTETNQRGHSAIEASAKNHSGHYLKSFGNLVQLRTRQTSLQNSEDGTKHDSPQFGHSLKNVQQSVRPVPFAFSQLKRMLKHARRLSAKEDPYKLSDHTTSSCICNFQDFEKCTPAADKKTNRSNAGCETAFDTKTTASMEVKEEVSGYKVKTFGSGDRKEGASTCGSKLENSKLSKRCYADRNKPALLVADRKSHSKSSSSGRANFPVKHRSKTWNERKHIPDYDLLPVFSPQRTPEHGFVYPHKRVSSYGTWKAGKDKRVRDCRERDNSYSSSLRKNNEAPDLAHHEDQFHQLQILGTSKNINVKDLRDAEMHESISSFKNDSGPQGFSKMVKANICETLKLNKPFGEPFELGSSAGRCSNQGIDIAHSDMEAESSGLSISVRGVHNLKLSSSTHECSSRTSSEESVSIKDPGEHSSPVSVLERYFIDDDTATSSTESEQVGPSALSQQFGIQEDHGAGVLNETHGLVFNYIFEALKASFANWDDLTSNYHVTDQFLGQILWNKLEGWPHQFNVDHSLLVDFVIEAIEYIHQGHFRCSPWLLFVLPKIGSRMAQESIASEVMNYLNQHLNLCPPPRTLQQLVEKDLTRFGMWMDIGANTDDIVAEMVERILEEMMIEAAIE